MSKTASVHNRKRKSFLRHFYVYFAYRHLFVNMAKNLDFSKSKGRPTNKNVSTSAVTRAEKIIISELVVVCQADLLKKASSHVIPSFVWRYFGELHHQSSAAGGTVVIDYERTYCRLVHSALVSYERYAISCHAECNM